MTREEKLNQGLPVAEEFIEETDEAEDYNKLRDDLGNELSLNYHLMYLK